MRSLILAVLLVGCAAHRGAPEPVVHRSQAEVSVPPDAASWYLKAVVAEELGDHDEALRAVGWVVRLDRSSPWAWMAQGRLHEHQGDLPAALASYVQAQQRGQPAELTEALGRVRGLLCDQQEVGQELPEGLTGCPEQETL